MSSKIRFTPEFLAACELLWRDGFDKGVCGEDDFPDFKSFFVSATKVKEDPSLEESSKLPFNPSKCEARLEKHGWAIQCTRSPFEDGCLCKTHQNMLSKLDEGKDIPYGRFNQERPDKTLDKGNTIKWGPKKARSKNSNSSPVKPKLKMGEMRDYLSTRIPNTVHKDLKKADLMELYLKEKEKENTSDEEISPLVQGQEESTVESVPSLSEESEEEIGEMLEAGGQEEPVEGPVEEEVDDSDTIPFSEPVEEEVQVQEEPVEEEVQVQEEPVEEEVQVQEEPVDNGEGTGLTLEPARPKTISEYKELFKSLNINYDGMKGLRAFKQAYVDHLEEEDNKTDDMSEDDLQEDTSSFEETDFEGVSYLEDEETGKIYNMKHQHVGKWNEDVDDIIWVSEVYKETHEQSRP
jgi:hypothetical protein